MKYEKARKSLAGGTLLKRLSANAKRFEQGEYTLDYIRKMDKCEWPGDYRGRVLLALSQLSGSMQKPCKILNALAEDTLLYMDSADADYKTDDASLINEQHMSGYSWLLRALLAYADYAGDLRFSAAAAQLFERYYLTGLPRYPEYPLPANIQEEGKPIGAEQKEAVNGWRLSSDAGCVFISLDGLSDFYVHTGDARAKMCFDALCRRFLEIDPMEARLQTHATLSALRGLLRMYRATGEAYLLKTVIDRFEMYLNHALTLNFANYNWFGYPRWTECCAVVDSYILALELFREGIGEKYLSISEKILYNALLAGQRSNGGFGSDCCLTPDGDRDTLLPYEQCYEAFWCCSMRGAEGLTAAISGNVHRAGNAIHITGWREGKTAFEDVEVEIRGDYPWADAANLKITGNEEMYSLVMHPIGSEMKIEWNGAETICRDQESTLTVPNGAELNVNISLQTQEKPCGKGKAHWRGAMMLDEKQLPISDRIRMPTEELCRGNRILF